MANIKISELNSITNIVSTDFIVFTDSGSSLVTFRMPISSFSNFFALSGSALSSSWASSSLSSISASFNNSASYSHTSSVGLFLKYNGSPNGTASYALFAPTSLTSSFASSSNSSLYSITSSVTLKAPTGSLVVSSSFATKAQNVDSSSFAGTASIATTASYINLAMATSIPLWYGPFTSSTFSGSKWGWSDPLNQQIPIMVLYDNTDVLFQVSVKVISSRFANNSAFFTIEARTLPITSSNIPGKYLVPTASNTPNNADDFCQSQTYFNDSVDSDRFSGRDYLFMYRKTLNRGSYIIWLSSTLYDNTTINRVDYPLAGNHDPAVSTRRLLDDNAIQTLSTGQKQVWLRPMSGSHKCIVYSSNTIKQGIPLAPTSSLNRETAALAVNWGRIFAFPFLVTSQSLVNGFCSASCNYMSGSTTFNAQFSASTTGLSENDTIISFLGNLPNVATNWTTSVVQSGISLSSVPIRTHISTSKF